MIAVQSLCLAVCSAPSDLRDDILTQTQQQAADDKDPKPITGPLKRLCSETSIVLCIDMQERLVPVMHEGQQTAERIRKLLEIAALFSLTVAATEHEPEKLGQTVPIIAAGNLTTVAKSTFSACGNPELDALLAGCRDVLITGCEVHACVLQTAIDLLNLGYGVILIDDCLTSRRENDKRVAIDWLCRQGARSMTYEAVPFELAGSTAHAAFKDFISIIR